MPQIILNNISKTFRVSERPQGKFGAIRGAFVRTKKEIKALENISFSINEGDLVGYIGPNGAGKSTTVKIMSGILNPDSGTCQILGNIPWKNRVKHVANIGVVFGQRSQLWWDVPVSDSFDLLKDIYTIPAQKHKERLKKLTEVLDIDSLMKTPVRQLSLGQRMRCEIAASLLHEPKILFLDEPTIGLDAVSKLALRDFLKNENRQNGVTMILTTHDMDDIEALCKKVMVIGHGRLLYNSSLTELKKRYAPLRSIRASISADISFDPSKIQISGAENTEFKNNEFIVWFDPIKNPSHEIVANVARSLPITDIIIEEQDIDLMIADMYREMDL